MITSRPTSFFSIILKCLIYLLTLSDELLEKLNLLKNVKSYLIFLVKKLIFCSTLVIHNIFLQSNKILIEYHQLN